MPNIAELAIIHGRPGAIAAEVADSTALVSFNRFPGRITDLSVIDVGKFIRQLDTGQIWCLVGFSPAAWTAVTGDIDPGVLAAAIAVALGTTLAGYLKRDGSNSPSHDIDFAGFKLTGLADGTSASHAATVGQLTAVLTNHFGSGSATLVAGTKAVTVTLPANAVIFLKRTTAIGAIGEVDVFSQTTDGFTLTSNSSDDLSVMAYFWFAP
jgi:hypothetical protein